MRHAEGGEVHSGTWKWRGLWGTDGDIWNLEERPDRKVQTQKWNVGRNWMRLSRRAWRRNPNSQETEKGARSHKADRKRQAWGGQEQFPIWKKSQGMKMFQGNGLFHKRVGTKQPNELWAKHSPDLGIMKSLVERWKSYSETNNWKNLAFFQRGDTEMGWRQNP